MVDIQNRWTAKRWDPGPLIAKYLTAEDARFPTDRDALYASFPVPPRETSTIASLVRGKMKKTFRRVIVLGGWPVRYRRRAPGLRLDLHENGGAGFVPVVRIDGRGLA